MRAMLLHSVLALALAASADSPAPPPAAVLELTGPASVEVGRKCVLVAETTARKVTWRVPPGADAMPLDGKRLAVWAPPGTYTFRAQVPSGEDVAESEIVLTVTGARPPPVPPGPDPKPVDPVPPKEMSPWGNAPGLRVMISFQDRDLNDAKKVTPQQLSILTGARVRDYLNAKCTKSAVGNDPQYFIWDHEEDVSAVPLPWQDAHKRAKGRLWYVVGNGDRWEEGPLPANPDAFLAALKKYE